MKDAPNPWDADPRFCSFAASTILQRHFVLPPLSCCSNRTSQKFLELVVSKYRVCMRSRRGQSSLRWVGVRLATAWWESASQMSLGKKGDFLVLYILKGRGGGDANRLHGFPLCSGSFLVLFLQESEQRTTRSGIEKEEWVGVWRTKECAKALDFAISYFYLCGD